MARRWNLSIKKIKKTQKWIREKLKKREKNEKLLFYQILQRLFILNNLIKWVSNELKKKMNVMNIMGLSFCSKWNRRIRGEFMEMLQEGEVTINKNYYTIPLWLLIILEIPLWYFKRKFNDRSKNMGNHIGGNVHVFF